MHHNNHHIISSLHHFMQPDTLLRQQAKKGGGNRLTNNILIFLLLFGYGLLGRFWWILGRQRQRSGVYNEVMVVFFAWYLHSKKQVFLFFPRPKMYLSKSHIIVFFKNISSSAAAPTHGPTKKIKAATIAHYYTLTLVVLKNGQVSWKRESSSWSM